MIYFGVFIGCRSLVFRVGLCKLKICLFDRSALYFNLRLYQYWLSLLFIVYF